MAKDWNKISAISTLIGVFVTSGIGIAGLILMWWIYRNPIQPSPPSSASRASGVSVTSLASVLPWWMPVMVVAAIVLAAFLHFVAIRQRVRISVPTEQSADWRNAPPTKLKILSAWWGRPGVADRSVTELIQKRGGDAMAFLATRDELGDPAEGHHKRLQIEYTYGGTYHKVSREENDFIVLPEDFRLKDHMAHLENEASAKDETIRRITTEVDEWKVKWENERGGSSARDEIIKQLTHERDSARSERDTAYSAAVDRHNATTKLLEEERRISVANKDEARRHLKTIQDLSAELASCREQSPPAKPIPTYTTDNTTPQTAHELLGFYRGRTALQADALMRPHKGLWLAFEGQIMQLLPDANGCVAVLWSNSEDRGVGDTVNARFGKEWLSYLQLFNTSQLLKVRGKISDTQNGQQLYLLDCVCPDAFNFPASASSGAI